MRRVLFLLSLSLLLFSATIFSGLTQDNLQVHLSFTGKNGEMSIMWILPVETPDTYDIIEYTFDKEIAATQEYAHSMRAEKKKYVVSEPGQTDYSAVVYEAILKNLLPNIKVHYRIGNKELNKFSRRFSFISPPLDDEKNKQTFEPYQILAMGDQDVHEEASKTKQNMYSHVISRKFPFRRSLNPQAEPNHSEIDIRTRFAIHVGDLPYAWNEEKWDQWGDLMESITSKVPYMVTPGNHEGNRQFASYKNRFSSIVGDKNSEVPSVSDPSKMLQGNGDFWYSFNFRNIHVVSISSEHPHDPSSEQYAWLEADLAKAASAEQRAKVPWILVFAHRPIYSANHPKDHGHDLKLRSHIEPLFEKHSVDFYVYGHVHLYERTCAVRNDKCVWSEEDKQYHADELKKHGLEVSETGLDEMFSEANPVRVLHNPKGTVCVGVGTGGYTLHKLWLDPVPKWTMHKESTFGFTKIVVLDWNVIAFEFVLNEDKKVTDYFTVVKTNI